MRRARRRIGWAPALVVFAAVSGLSAKTYVVVPAVEWDALLPCVQANTVPELQGAEFSVFVCSAHTDRSVVAPFDDALATSRRRDGGNR